MASSPPIEVSGDGISSLPRQNAADAVGSREDSQSCVIKQSKDESANGCAHGCEAPTQVPSDGSANASDIFDASTSDIPRQVTDTSDIPRQVTNTSDVPRQVTDASLGAKSQSTDGSDYTIQGRGSVVDSGSKSSFGSVSKPTLGACAVGKGAEGGALELPLSGSFADGNRGSIMVEPPARQLSPESFAYDSSCSEVSDLREQAAPKKKRAGSMTSSSSGPVSSQGSMVSVSSTMSTLVVGKSRRSPDGTSSAKTSGGYSGQGSFCGRELSAASASSASNSSWTGAHSNTWSKAGSAKSRTFRDTVATTITRVTESWANSGDNRSSKTSRASLAARVSNLSNRMHNSLFSTDSRCSCLVSNTSSKRTSDHSHHSRNSTESWSKAGSWNEKACSKLSTIQARNTLRLSITSSLRRGVNLAEALSRVGHHFASNQPSAEWYSLSDTIDSIDLFYSHSWHDSRWSKIIALCCTHNSLAAFRASLFFSVLMCILQRLRLVPTLWPPATLIIAGDELVLETGGWCFFGSPIIYLIFLFFWQAFAEYLRQPIYVFLDKLCIHQTDTELKGQGIAGIGGILKHSQQMVVLWSPQYFSRLWCMFEVAVWCSLDRVNDLVIIPIAKTTMVPLGMLFLFTISFFRSLSRLGFNYIILGSFFFVCSVLALAMVHAMRGTMRALIGFHNELDNCKIAEATCSCCTWNHIHPESGAAVSCDRELIMNTIADLFPASEGDVAAGCRELDKRIQTEWVQRVCETLGGPDGLPLRAYLIIAAPMMWQSLDVLSAPNLGTGIALLRVMLSSVIHIVDYIAWIRIFLFICVRLSRQRTNRFHDMFISCCGLLMTMIIGLCFYAKTTMIEDNIEAFWPQLMNGIIVTTLVYSFLRWEKGGLSLEDSAMGKCASRCVRTASRCCSCSCKWPCKKREKTRPHQEFSNF